MNICHRRTLKSHWEIQDQEPARRHCVLCLRCCWDAVPLLRTFFLVEFSESLDRIFVTLLPQIYSPPIHQIWTILRFDSILIDSKLDLGSIHVDLTIMGHTRDLGHKRIDIFGTTSSSFNNQWSLKLFSATNSRIANESIKIHVILLLT